MSSHHSLITEQAGTVKTFLVKEMEDEGLGTSILTVHSCYGLPTADLPSEWVIIRSQSDNDDGSFMFNSPVFARAITHQYGLVNVLQKKMPQKKSLHDASNKPIWTIVMKHAKYF